MLRNLRRNSPEQPREAKSIPAGENCIQNLAANNEIDNTAADNTFQSLMM